MAQKEITVLAKIKAKKPMTELLKQQLLSLIAPTRQEIGCITYELHQGPDDNSSFMFYEIWASKDALDRHIQTPHLKALLDKADDLFAGPLDVTIWEKLT